LVLVTSRPEYDGALTRARGAQAIALAPLGDSDTAALLGELLGPDPSIDRLTAIICDRAAGNPFFAEEMVRELVQRGVLAGERGGYVCTADAADVVVPATVQAAIKARVDRLSSPARRTLTAASVIGARFEENLLAKIGVEAVVDELLSAELIDQVRFTPSAEYAFRHPLIRAVAYESQLKSDRAEWHRRVAAAIQDRDPASVEENAALIAEHLESAGELHAAYGWGMRAGGWSANRNVAAARVSWERARRIADALPADDSGRLTMRIAPRTMLCATDFQARSVEESRGRFEELRELCNTAGDKVSLAIGMTGLASELLFTGRAPEASRLASEQMALLESIGDPSLTMGLSFVGFLSWFDVGEFGELLRWSQTVVDLADGDPTKGAGFGIGSPLAIGLAFRGVARWWLGHAGWREDLRGAVAMARHSDPTTFALACTWAYGVEFVYGVLRPDDAALLEIEDAVQTAHTASSDLALLFAENTLAIALLYRDTAAERQRGREATVQTLDILRERIPSLVPVVEMMTVPERATHGDRDAAIAMMRRDVDELHDAGRREYAAFGAGMLAEALLERGADGDLVEAQEAIDRITQLRAEGGAIRDILLLRLRALLAQARGDDVAFKDFARRYRAMAESLGFEGHITWAEAMIE
jgi:hypothetical protein